MSGISTSTEAVYRTCYHIDLAAKKATLGKYNYTEMMKKAAQQTDLPCNAPQCLGGQNMAAHMLQMGHSYSIPCLGE